LTCISQPSFEMGQKAAELLINQLNEPDEMDHKKTIIRLETQLTEREST